MALSATPSAASPLEVLRQVQQVSMRFDPDAFANLMAEDGVFEWPHTPPGAPSRIQGRENIRSFLTAAATSRIRLHEIRSETVHQTLDPEVVIAEYEAHGEITATGQPYQQSIVLVLRVRNGQIMHIRDYLNPLALAEAIKRSPT